MTDQQITAGEARVIAEATKAGVSRVDIPFVGANEQVKLIPMCGLCGRMVCYPGCPGTEWNSDGSG